ncbi:uncharacterized protein METZ01_LOCUS286994 [marine metagenome]|jgi:hypothetical protein|uniref:Uncharacterized protein n=1 Tax=marine metagenome TaxID=408172 RepID=A0A382LBV1_9ZZZZ|tara:strand:- start:39 stop:335 length:297 start_codon:yes stop_codon:yes gene_type:complete
MSFIRREWTSADADDWHKEDWLAIIFSVVSYIALVIGTALSFLTITVGFVILALGIVSAGIMMWIIDPKLRKISSEYEKKQKGYLRQLEDIQKWETEK